MLTINAKPKTELNLTHGTKTIKAYLDIVSTKVRPDLRETQVRPKSNPSTSG
jgi:hypothetical protein